MADELFVPTLVGPVSTLSRKLRVQGHVVGATVRVVGVMGRLVAEETPSTPGDAFVHVRNGVTLQAGEWLQARQSLGGSAKSELSPEDAKLQVLGPPQARDAGPLTLVTHPYECGECVYVEGAYPGANARVFGSAAGNGEATGTFARFPITRLAKASATAQQVGVFAGAAAPIGNPTAPPSTQERRLKPPSPLIVGSVAQCAGGIDIDGIIDGATVEVEQDRKARNLLPARDRRCVDVDAVFWPVDDLQKGDILRVRQTICGATSDPSPDVHVGPAAVPTPWLYAPCAGSVRVIVGGLHPTSDVFVTRTRQGAAPRTFRGYAYASTSIFVVPQDAFVEADELEVRQVLCNVSSATSPRVFVRAGRPLEKPVLRGPIFECASRVRVEKVPRGAVVEIISDFHDASSVLGIIGSSVALGPGSTVDVPVPSLSPDDTLWARVRDCGKGVLSGDEPVHRVGDLRAPTVEPVVACAPIVVKDVVPGAVLELHVQSTPKSPLQFVPPTVVCPTTQHAFPVPATLRVGSVVRARQRVCGKPSPMSAPQTAVAGALSLVPGSVRRLSQLTGAKDEGDPKLPHPNNTAAEYHLPGMDLGVPLEHAGRLYLLFGDSSQKDWVEVTDPLTQQKTGAWVATHPEKAGILKPIAEVVDVPDDPEDGLRLRFLTEANDPTTVQRLRLRDVDTRLSASDPWPSTSIITDLDSAYDVPTGAFSYDGRVHVFVMRKVPSMPFVPTVLRDADGTTIGGRSVLASGSSFAHPLDAMEVVDVRTMGGSADAATRWKFVQVSPQVIPLANIPELGATGDGLLLWGAGAFRQSDVSFAWARLQPGAPIPPPSQWHFLTGFSGAAPLFTQGAMDAAIGLLQWSDDKVLNAATGPVGALANYTVGEFSITYVAQMRAWLMLFASANVVWARIASVPWGPWLPASPNGTVHGTGILDPSKDLPPGLLRTGVYGTYGLQRYYRWDDQANALRIFFVAGSLVRRDESAPEVLDINLDHGQVHLFSADLRCVAI